MHIAAIVVWLAATAAHAQPIQEQRSQRTLGVVEAGHPCLGRWEGTAVDHPPTSGRPYGVTIQIHQTQGRNCGTIEYTLGCGGVLHDCVVTDDRIEALEEYTHNPPGACAPAGRFAASCGEVMQWEWRETVPSTQQRSTGTLRRVGAARPPAPAAPPSAQSGGCGCAAAPRGGRAPRLPAAASIAVALAWGVALSVRARR